MKLETYLSANKISDAKFAEMIGVDRSSVSRMRSKGQIPSKDAILAIARVTGGEVTANDFFGIASVSRRSSARAPKQGQAA